MHTTYVSVRLGLLALLDGADMYGYQLKSAFEAWTGGVWPLNIGRVYTTLSRLERDGLVAGTEQAQASGGERHHVYSITPEGKRVLADWFAESPADGHPPRDELIAKVLLALAGGVDRALDVVTAQRTALYGALQARRRALRSAASAGTSPRTSAETSAAATEEPGAEPETDALAPVLVQDALVARAEAELRWLDQCEARLLSGRNADATTGRTI